ncbi:MAG: alanine--tRNA ligase-related protein, partial [Lachnospiraceae bacterium]|nr:alanine--tRNA ligase-related protein [Lachnospiraceae bacterium]
GVPSDRIFRFGKEDNFWEHGKGPCGPCSEIYYDRGEKYGCGKPTCTVGCDCDRYMEVWNNVFTQFDNDGNGNYTELSQKNIDTGMGLERLAVVCQDVGSIFEVDTNKELMEKISLVTGHLYNEDEVDDISLRIILDHIKSCTFMLSDGIMPSNEGRGYVLRRAVRHGRKLGVKKIFMSDLAKTVIALNKSHYAELDEKKDLIFNILNQEEEKFVKTIDQGLSILNEYAVDLLKNNKKVLDGEKAFKLYDTFGFPLDITKEILEEKEMTLDEKKFMELMEKQKDTARSARKVSTYMGADSTCFDELPKEMESKFVGYDENDVEAKVLAIASSDKLVDSIKQGEEGVIILDKTTLYPLMGGQEGDKGYLYKGKDVVYEVYDTIEILNTKIGHIGKVVSGEFKVGDKVTTHYDVDNRHYTAIN